MTSASDPISSVVRSGLCTGCGACAGLFPAAIRMVDDPQHGRRPVVARTPMARRAAEQAITVCGGRGMDHRELPTADRIDRDWGPVLGVWEGWAADAEIRHRGSSGGAVTALALHLLEAGEVGGALHIAQKAVDPRLNEAVISRDRAGLLRGAGSRYAPASPCEGLGEVAAGNAPVALIGKPCDVASATLASRSDMRLADKIAVRIAIFCAGAPTLEATGDLLDRLGVPRDATLTDLRYRGAGWPGLMQARWTDAEGRESASEQISYAEGWGRILQAKRPWRCRICADHTGEFADISVGDPWHNPPEGETDAGRSLIVARTPRGRTIVEAAIAAGALVAEQRDRSVVALAQPNLLDTRGAVWGRRLAMRMAMMATPDDRGLGNFALWLGRLSLRQKAQSLGGSLKRIWRRRLWRPIAIEGVEASR